MSLKVDLWIECSSRSSDDNDNDDLCGVLGIGTGKLMSLGSKDEAGISWIEHVP